MADQTTGSSSDKDHAKPEIPDFDLIRLIGRGGFGEVWLAKNRATGHLRAVKAVPLRAPGATDPATREITSLTRLEAAMQRQHPCLVTIHHVGKTEDHLFYVMELADNHSGGAASADVGYRPATLQNRLASGPLAAEKCSRFARQLLTGLATLHQAGMVHRDVKPANCLFVDGAIKLADFGLLTEASPQVSRVGTQKYMPPDGRMDFRADVYAAGLVIYEMLTGLPADRFPRLGKQAREIVRDPNLNALLRLVLRACQPVPEERFQNAGEMLAEVERGAVAVPSRPLHPRRLILGSIGCLCVAILLATIWLRPWANQRPTPPGGGESVRAVGDVVDVNFITRKPFFDAEIYLDGVRQTRPDGSPYQTPCTVENLPAKVQHVVLKREGLPDRDLGRVNLAETTQIVVRWNAQP
ncbi:MAG: serine/threonine protein kinase [Planctomycetes bacterium]|nr:serine/threonine protein kinase [Planctomycetota bacterium]